MEENGIVSIMLIHSLLRKKYTLICHYCYIHIFKYFLTNQVRSLTLYYQLPSWDFQFFALSLYCIACMDYFLYFSESTLSDLRFLYANCFLWVYKFQLTIFCFMSIILYSAIYHDYFLCIQQVMSQDRVIIAGGKWKGDPKAFK